MANSTLTVEPIPETAGDIADTHHIVVRAEESASVAAGRLVEAGATAAPVQDADGRLVGLFSLSDAVRCLTAPPPTANDPPRSCLFQDTLRGHGGRQLVLCTLAEGHCSFQRAGEAAGRAVTTCSNPHEVASEWQVVFPPRLPTADVRHHMTADPITVRLHTPIHEVARLLSEHAIHQVPVTDEMGKLVGVVSSLRVLDVLRRHLVGGPDEPHDANQGSCLGLGVRSDEP